jgi:hypothetical protein
MSAELASAATVIREAAPLITPACRLRRLIPRTIARRQTVRRTAALTTLSCRGRPSRFARRRGRIGTPLGCWEIPARWTRRVSNSMKNSPKMRRRRIDAEEIARVDARGLGVEELAPGRTVTRRRRLQPGAEQARRTVLWETRIASFASSPTNPREAPARILARDAHDPGAGRGSRHRTVVVRGCVGRVAGVGGRIPGANEGAARVSRSGRGVDSVCRRFDVRRSTETSWRRIRSSASRSASPRRQRRGTGGLRKRRGRRIAAASRHLAGALRSGLGHPIGIKKPFTHECGGEPGWASRSIQNIRDRRSNDPKFRERMKGRAGEGARRWRATERASRGGKPRPSLTPGKAQVGVGTSAPTPAQ